MRFKVKIIANHSDAYEFEAEINEFLETPRINIIDIKYQNWGENHPEMIPGHEVFSAMIYYIEGE